MEKFKEQIEQVILLLLWGNRENGFLWAIVTFAKVFITQSHFKLGSWNKVFDDDFRTIAAVKRADALPL